MEDMMSMRTQAERNDGDEGDRHYRTLVDLTWSETWIEESGEARNVVEADYADEIARMDADEVRFLSCSPGARERAEKENDIATEQDWDSASAYYTLLADAAMAADGAIISIVIVKSLDDRRIVIGEVPGPWASEAIAVAEALIDGQRYEVRDGIIYAQGEVARTARRIGLS